jgi:hypothetical protein
MCEIVILAHIWDAIGFLQKNEYDTTPAITLSKELSLFVISTNLLLPLSIMDIGVLMSNCFASPKELKYKK